VRAQINAEFDEKTLKAKRKEDHQKKLESMKKGQKRNTDLIKGMKDKGRS
jgi:hypothetical protein